MENDELIDEIKKMYLDGRPNGFLLEWDVNRFFEELVLLFIDHKVSNDTDFNYSFCNSYNIALGNTSDNEKYVLTVKASFIADSYIVHITRYSKSKRNGKVVSIEECQEYASELALVREFMTKKGFVETPRNMIDLHVDGIELELAELATLGKCLYDDYE